MQTHVNMWLTPLGRERVLHRHKDHGTCFAVRAAQLGSAFRSLSNQLTSVPVPVLFLHFKKRPLALGVPLFTVCVVLLVVWFARRKNL